ncbi:putative F-box/FBD/LRR-repeat protein At4g03220 [Ricinus communis]|uniref:putative F-box/FBD/LRR-repeat protein At4g03220 n=1 Tax=Ricinus communis TaxID=3988 RepID=UPI00201AD099|nr:putative F-box/FBD/LRR-repeat protein At4g03220 [Ricinus communis]
METRSAKRRKLPFAESCDQGGDPPAGIDRISDLPDPILHHILFLLSVKSIARTSTLSKRWRSVWYSFPDLDFTTISTANTLANISQTNFLNTKRPPPHSLSMDFISQVLALRDKHSDLRTLRFRARSSFSCLNGLIRSAIRHNVQELDVEVATEDHFNFPRGVITSKTLRVLKLKSMYPGFRLLPSSVMTDGFRSLQVLSLSLVILYDQSSLLDLFTESSFPRLKKLNLDACFGLKHLKISCRGLEDLTLENCFQLHGLEICCGKLDKLRVASCFDAYYEKSWVKINSPNLRIVFWECNAITGTSSLENLTSLREASVGFFLLHEDVSAEKLQSVWDLLSGLSNAYSLTLESECVEILSNKNNFSHVLYPFSNLKILKLETGFNKSNVPGLASLFRSSPALHTLVLKIINDCKIERRQWNRDLWDMSTTKEEQFWESQIHTLKPFLSHLKVVKIHGFLECENEVSLAKFLLKHGKCLQEMTLCTARCNYRDSLRRQKVRSQMMGFSWASSNAKVAFQ